MQTVLRLGVLSVFVCAIAFAETWTGRLVDASCDVQQMSASCNPTSSTTAFALVTSNHKLYKFDSEGNEKTAEALKSSQSGAERSSNPEAQNSPITATVKGTLESNEIKVDSIQVH